MRDSVTRIKNRSLLIILGGVLVTTLGYCDYQESSDLLLNLNASQLDEARLK